MLTDRCRRRYEGTMRLRIGRYEILVRRRAQSKQASGPRNAPSVPEMRRIIAEIKREEIRELNERLARYGLGRSAS